MCTFWPVIGFFVYLFMPFFNKAKKKRYSPKNLVMDTVIVIKNKKELTRIENVKQIFIELNSLYILYYSLRNVNARLQLAEYDLSDGKLTYELN